MESVALVFVPVVAVLANEDRLAPYRALDVGGCREPDERAGGG